MVPVLDQKAPKHTAHHLVVAPSHDYLSFGIGSYRASAAHLSESCCTCASAASFSACKRSLLYIDAYHAHLVTWSIVLSSWSTPRIRSNLFIVHRYVSTAACAMSLRLPVPGGKDNATRPSWSHNRGAVEKYCDFSRNVILATWRVTGHQSPGQSKYIYI